MSTLYAPGGTPVAVTPRGFAVLDHGAPAALLARIKALVTDGRGLGGVIEALTGAYGTSITALPAFAVALAEGAAVRIAVRGDFAFEVEGATTEHVSGAGVTTWTERVVPGAVRVTLTATETGASAPAEFEIVDGIVLAAAIVWDASARTPAPALAPEPIPATPVPIPAAPEPIPAAPEPIPAAPEPTPVVPVGAVPPAVDVRPVPPVTPVVPLAPEAPPAAPSVPGLIDSRAVLSIADAETLLPFDSALSARPDAAGDDAHAPTADFDASMGATIIRSGETAVPGADTGAPASPAPAGDHDGETISLAQARAMRGAAAFRVPADSVPSPLAPPRPPAPGRVRVSTGQVLPLDRTVVIGRRPRSTRVSGTDLPHLVAVDSPQQDISRSHVELRVEGESIVATDLRTTNGTTLLRPGADPVRLHPGEATVVVFGDVLDLGDGITVAIEAPA